MSFSGDDLHATASDVQEYERFSAIAVTTVVTFLAEQGQTIRLEVVDPVYVCAAVIGRDSPNPRVIRCTIAQLNDVIQLGRAGTPSSVRHINFFSQVPLRYELKDGRRLIVKE